MARLEPTPEYIDKGTHGEISMDDMKQYRILSGWLALHEDELYAAWINKVRNIPFNKIDPLK